MTSLNYDDRTGEVVDAAEGQPEAVGGLSGRGMVAKVQLVRLPACAASLPSPASGDGVLAERGNPQPLPDTASEEEFPPLGSGGRKKRRSLRAAPASDGLTSSPPTGGSEAQGGESPAVPATYVPDVPVYTEQNSGEAWLSASAGMVQPAVPARLPRSGSGRLVASLRKRKVGGRGGLVSRDGDDGDTESSIREPSPLAKRGRGRPPTTGNHAGQYAVRRKAAEEEQEFDRLQTEREMSVELAAKRAGERRLAERRSTSQSCSSSAEARRARVRPERATASAMLAADMISRASSDLDDVARVAATSRNLKGTSVRALNEAVVSLRDMVEGLMGRSIGEEVCRLEAANRHLRGKNDDLRRELRVMRERLDTLAAAVSGGVTAGSSSPPPPQT